MTQRPHLMFCGALNTYLLFSEELGEVGTCGVLGLEALKQMMLFGGRDAPLL